MLKNLIAQLKRVDVAARARAVSSSVRADGVLRVTVDGWIYSFVYQNCSRAPYPNELADLNPRRAELAAEGLPLLIAPYVSRPLGEQLTKHGWSWADYAGNYDLRGPDLRLSHTGESRVVPARSSLPRGNAGRALIRSLLGYRVPEEGWWTTAGLAELVGVTPSAVSQVLSRLHDQELVDHPGHGRWRVRAEPLLRAFQREYRGFTGSEQAWYALDSMTEVAERLSRSFKGNVALSADIGPDQLAPWRVPTELIVYVRQALEPAALASVVGGVPANGRADGNIFVRWSRDRSVFLPDLTLLDAAVDMPVADPVQQLFDLMELGGSDRAEAAQVLEQWILKRHDT